MAKKSIWDIWKGIGNIASAWRATPSGTTPRGPMKMEAQPESSDPYEGWGDAETGAYGPSEPEPPPPEEPEEEPQPPTEGVAATYKLRGDWEGYRIAVDGDGNKLYYIYPDGSYHYSLPGMEGEPGGPPGGGEPGDGEPGDGGAGEPPEPPPDRDYTSRTGADFTDAEWLEIAYIFSDAFDGPLHIAEMAKEKQGLSDYQKQELARLKRDYAGIPIALGYYDENGNWNTVQVLSVAKTLLEILGLDFEDWMAEHGYDWTNIQESGSWQAQQDLLQRMTSPEGMEADASAAYDYMERMLGFEPGEFKSSMQELNDALSGGIAGTEGWTEETRREYERSLAQQVANVRDDTMRMVEALGAEGRTGQAFIAMDEISSQIADMRLQGSFKMMEADQAAKAMQYAALSQRYDSLASSGSQQAQYYMDQMQENRMAALGTYATQITQLQAQNTQYMDLFEQHAQILYQQFMIELSYDVAAIEFSSALFQDYMEEYLTKFQLWLAEKEVEMGEEAAEEAKDANDTSTGLAFLDFLLGLADLFF